MKSSNTIDTYIARYPKEVQALLKQMRATIKKAAPKAEETIKYGIPTFVQNGNLVHFGGFKHHIGFYPTPKALVAFSEELSKYTASKGAVQFPLDKPLPLALVTRIVKFRLKQVSQPAKEGDRKVKALQYKS